MSIPAENADASKDSPIETSYILKMKLLHTGLLMGMLAGWPGLAGAQLQLLDGVEPQAVFSGGVRDIAVVWQNTNLFTFQGGLMTRLLQASSATVAPLGVRAWKTLRVLPGQTVVETAALGLPPVKAPTRFIVQWLLSTNRVLGETEVFVYPTNLLDELKLLVAQSENNLGVLDPEKRLQPALKQAGIPFVDLGNTRLMNFGGKLALVGPCAASDPEWPGLAGRIRRLAQNGVPVVWIQSSPPKPDALWPSFYLVPAGQAGVLVVDPGLISDLPDRPQAQLNLNFFCKLALNPQPPALPELTGQP